MGFTEIYVRASWELHFGHWVIRYSQYMKADNFQMFSPCTRVKYGRKVVFS